MENIDTSPQFSDSLAQAQFDAGNEPEHSPKGASSAERWMNCPGSSILLNELKLPQSDEQDYRRDGVAAHEAAAHCLQQNLDTWEIVGQEFHGVKIDKVIADAVQMYLDAVRADITPSATLYVEVRIGADPETRPHPNFYGTADAVVYDTDITTVTDYKHGEGIVVEADNNPQLLYYAYGVLKTRTHVRSDRVVRLRIVQPRAWHEDGPIRECEPTAGEILQWGDTVLLPAMERAEIDNDFDAGKWCRFCPAKLFCPLLTGIFGAAAKANPNTIPGFGNKRIGLEYQQREAVKFYMHALEDEVYRRNMLGNTVPGTKLVLKKANRIFKDGADALFRARFGAAAVSPAELKSPAQMAAIGPDAKKLVEQWAYMPQTGLTVAPESDKKPAVKVEKAADTFAHLIEAGDNADTQATTGDTNGE